MRTTPIRLQFSANLMRPNGLVNISASFCLSDGTCHICTSLCSTFCLMYLCRMSINLDRFVAPNDVSMSISYWLSDASSIELGLAVNVLSHFASLHCPLYQFFHCPVLIFCRTLCNCLVNNRLLLTFFLRGRSPSPRQSLLASGCCCCVVWYILSRSPSGVVQFRGPFSWTFG